MLSRENLEIALNDYFGEGATVQSLEPKIGNVKDFTLCQPNQLYVGEVSVKSKGAIGTVKLSAEGDNEPTLAVATTYSPIALGLQLFQTFEVTDAVALFNGYLVTLEFTETPSNDWLANAIGTRPKKKPRPA